MLKLTTKMLLIRLVALTSQSQRICQKNKQKKKKRNGHCPHSILLGSVRLRHWIRRDLFLVDPIQMATRRGIFFNSKARSVETNVLLEGKTRSPPKIESTAILANEDPSSGSSSNSQTSPPKSATAASLPTGVVKKKLILKNSKRSLTKSIYAGPRKIFSTNYKVMRLISRALPSIARVCCSGQSITIES